MPDWISHILIVLIIAQVFNVKQKSLLVLGALLPDILGKLKLLNYFFESTPPIIKMLSAYGHSVIVSLLVAGLIALFFLYPYFKTFSLIGIGVITHFLSDGLFKSFTYNGYLPILYDWRSFQFLSPSQRQFWNHPLTSETTLFFSPLAAL